MSVYLYARKQCQGQVASNFGWGNLTRYAEGLPVERFFHLVQLTEHGITDDVGALVDEVGLAQEEHPPGFPDVDEVLQRLLALCRGHTDAKCVQVSDDPGLGE